MFFSLDSGRRRTNTMDLPEELILEIMYHLPIKKVAQLRCLSKLFNEELCSPRFAEQHAIRSRENRLFLLHFTCYCPNIFCKLQLFPPYSTRNVTLVGDDHIRISYLISSSKGRLLIQFRCGYGYCLYMFNPILGAYRQIPPPLEYKDRDKQSGIGFVDDHEDNFSSFKLVAAVCAQYYGPRAVKFLVFESESNKWEQVSVIQSDSGIVTRYSQPVYVNDRLYWLLEDGNLLVFDFKSKCPRIIAKPDGAKSPDVATWFGIDTWLGRAEGYLAYVVARKKEVVIYGFDDQRNLWETKNVIENVDNILSRKGRPILWDGKMLLLVSREKFREVYKYEIAGNKWQKIGGLETWADSIRCFHPFIPQFTPIPGCKFLHEGAGDGGPQGTSRKLVELQCLLTMPH